MRIKINKTNLELSSKPFSAHTADALIFPTNDYLWMGNEISKEIKKAAGSDMENDAIAKGPCAIGEIIVTASGKLTTYSHLLHAVCMEQDSKINEVKLIEYVKNSLETAKSYNCASIVLCPFYLPNCSMSPYKSAELTITACIDDCFIDTKLSSLIISIPDDEFLAIFSAQLNKAFSKKK